MKTLRLLGLAYIGIFTFSFVESVEAALITYAYEGTADTVDITLGVDSAPFDALIGQKMRIVYTFESSTPDGQPLDTLGAYAPVSIQLTIGGLSYSASSGFISIYDNHLLQDAYAVSASRISIIDGPDLGGLAVNQIAVGLFDNSQTIFISDALPLIQPNPADFPTLNTISVSYWDNQTQTSARISARGDVTIATVVPLPSAVWLFGSSLLGLIGVARRKAHV